MKKIILIIVAVVVLVGIGSFIGSRTKMLSGTTQSTATSNAIQVTSSGTVVTKMLTGTCNASTDELPLEATSTDAFTCTITGVEAGDKVFVSLPYSEAFGNYGSLVTDGKATASSGTITFGITNLSGTATSTFAAATTSVQYWVIDN